MNKFTKLTQGLLTLDIDSYLQEFPALPKAEFEKLLSRPISAYEERQVLCFEYRGELLFPEFQISKDGDIYPIIEDIICLLRGVFQPQVIYMYMCEDFYQLNGSVVDALANEELKTVILGVVDSIRLRSLHS